MKMITKIFSQLFYFPLKTVTVQTEERNFFDYSSREKIKIMRAAGREAQKEQQELLKAYDAKFGQV